jgi:hypothetical protein
MTNQKRLQRGKRLFRNFHGEVPHKVDKIQVKKDDVVIKIGPCVGLIYLDESDGKKYIHKFKTRSRPLLTVSDDGRRLYLLKGSYRFTDRGIVDV